MEDSMEGWIKKVSKASNEFETNNSDLKRRYLIRNIYAFNYIVSLIKVNKGSFGTGYPFTVLPKDLRGELPIIQEQIRYNDELVEQAKNSKRTNWICEGCLSQNYDDMPDLKQVCKPCPNMDNDLKPRKVMNRLPDLDMWMVCEDGHVEEAQDMLAKLLNKCNIHTSDVNPIQSIEDIEEISENIENGVMPKKFLAIDAHIIEYSKIKSLIEQVPSTLEQASKNNQIPYLPIHPKSYRKTWQYDDEAYNFIYDFMSAFTEFNFDDSLSQSLKEARNSVVTKYSPTELYGFFIESATDSNKRRNKTPELSKNFLNRIKSWKIEKNLDKPSNHDEADDDLNR